MHILSKFFLIVFQLKQNLQAGKILLTMESEYDLHSEISPGFWPYFCIFTWNTLTQIDKPEEIHNTEGWRAIEPCNTNKALQKELFVLFCHDSTSLIVRFHLIPACSAGLRRLLTIIQTLSTVNCPKAKQIKYILMMIHFSIQTPVTSWL